MIAKAESASDQTVMAHDAANRLVSITPASPATSAVFTLDLEVSPAEGGSRAAAGIEYAAPAPAPALSVVRPA